MKVYIVVALALVAQANGLTASTKAKSTASFGPKNCVMLTKSAQGSCVLSTDCEGTDLSKTEFAFDCVSQSSDIVRHSFGLGGFESNEEFDTEVKCDQCNSPAADVATQPAAPVKAQKVEAVAPASPKAKAKIEVPQRVPAAAVVKQTKHRQHTATEAKAQTKFWPFTSGSEEKKKKEPEVVKYGPKGCVSTWRSSEGHCIMRTDCKKHKEHIAKYEFGLVCVDKVGSPVRHLFGKDSFDPEETFDTLIKCDKCLGLEDIPDAVALNGEVVTMAKDIANLKDVMKNISINVKMLNDEVFKSAPGPAPAAAPSPAQEDKKPASLVHHSTEHHRAGGNLRHSHKKHHHEDDDDDDEDDRSDDVIDDREESPPSVEKAVMSDDDDDSEDGDPEDED